MGFEELVHETVNLELRGQTRSMEPYQFLLGMVLVEDVNHFQLSILAYNLNCWLALFQKEETATMAELTHRTMATTRRQCQQVPPLSLLSAKAHASPTSIATIQQLSSIPTRQSSRI